MQVVTRCDKGGWVEVADDDDGHKHSYKLPRDQKGIRLHPLPAARVSDEPSVRKGVKRTATIDATIKVAQGITTAGGDRNAVRQPASSSAERGRVTHQQGTSTGQAEGDDLEDGETYETMAGNTHGAKRNGSSHRPTDHRPHGQSAIAGVHHGRRSGDDLEDDLDEDRGDDPHRPTSTHTDLEDSQPALSFNIDHLLAGPKPAEKMAAAIQSLPQAGAIENSPPPPELVTKRPAAAMQLDEPPAVEDKRTARSRGTGVPATAKAASKGASKLPAKRAVSSANATEKSAKKQKMAAAVQSRPQVGS